MLEWVWQVTAQLQLQLPFCPACSSCLDAVLGHVQLKHPPTLPVHVAVSNGHGLMCISGC